MILAFQLDPEVAEMNGADIRLGAQLQERISYELRLTFLFMASDDVLVMPPTYWLESDVTVQILLAHSELIENGYIKFLMNEKTFEDFRLKKNFRYRRLMHISRFKKGYGGGRRDLLRGISTLILPKSFSAGHDTFGAFRSIGSQVLRKVFSRQTEIDYFLDRLEHTQRDVFIWESMIDELTAADIDVGKAEQAGLRTVMDGTYYRTYANAGFVIPGESEINHLIVIPSYWSRWCKLNKLRLAVRLLGLENWLRTASDSQLCEMKVIPEWRRIAARIRSQAEEGLDVETLVENLEGTRNLELVQKETKRMAKTRDKLGLPQEEELVGSIAFLTVPNLKAMGTRAMGATLQTLAEIVRDVEAGQPELRLFTTQSGYIVLLPDSASKNFVDVVSHLYDQCQIAGIALSVGIHRGEVSLLHDIDGSVTPIAPDVNKCARLAYANREKIKIPTNGNPSIIASIEFGNFSAESGLADISQDNWLFPLHRKEWAAKAEGKRDELFDVLIPPQNRFTQIEQHSDSMQTCDVEVVGGCLLIAYDLPKFSGGDQSRVVSRFFDVSRIVKQRLRRSISDGEILLSPGGDGAIIMITGMSLADAYTFANDVHEGLDVLDRIRPEEAGAAVRVGLHYSGIAVYTDANGVRRGIGDGLFVADALANDEKGREEEEVVFSNVFQNVASQGDNTVFEQNFNKLDPIITETGIEVGRFSKKVG